MIMISILNQELYVPRSEDKLNPIILAALSDTNFRLTKRNFRILTDLGSLNETLIVQWESHLGCPGLYRTCGVIDLRSSDALRRETEYVNTQQ